MTGVPSVTPYFHSDVRTLLRKLRANSAIKGINIQQKQYKLAAYADDILLFLTDPITTIPNLLADFTLFKTLSNLQINFNKSKALNITLPRETVKLCRSNFPFVWEKSEILYLGIKITTDLKDLYAKNFLPLLRSIQGDLQKWNLGSFSWLGRIAILKMNILPRILYLLQALPISLPASFFASYKLLSRTFVWASKTPRIGWDRLVLPKRLGGLGLPDLQKYHWACHLTRLVDWHIHRPSKDWIALEASFAHLPLANTPWMTHTNVPKEFTTHPLIRTTLSLFKRACKILAFTPSPGPMTPLDDNPAFPPGLLLKDPAPDTLSSPARAQKFFLNGSFLSFPTLATTPLMSRRRRIDTKFSRNGTGPPTKSTTSTLLSLLPAGGVITLEVLYFTSGGNAPFSNPSGQTFMN